MQKLGAINDLSQQLLDSVPKLEEGEIKSFRLLGGIKDAVTGKVRFGSAKAIPLHDKIRDPHTGRIVEIGVVEETNDQGKPIRWRKFWVTPEGANVLHNGQFSVKQGNTEDEEAYLFFMLTNKNLSNKNRSTREKAVFELIDEEVDLQIQSQKADTLFKALQAVSLMDEEDLREFAAVENWNPKLSKSSLLTKVKIFAQENPDVFLEKQGNPDMQKALKIQKAFEAGIIVFNAAEEKVVWGHNGKTIALVSREDGENEVQQFLAWTKQSGNGTTILNAIVKQLLARQAEAAKK